jgi:hypothetical protein
MTARADALRAPTPGNAAMMTAFHAAGDWRRIDRA